MALLVLLALLVLVAVTAIVTSVPSGVPNGTVTFTLTVLEAPSANVTKAGCTLLMNPRLSAANIRNVSSAPRLCTVKANLVVAATGRLEMVLETFTSTDLPLNRDEKSL